MPCKGKCIRHRTFGRYYATGNKRCQHGNLFIKWEGLWCPCCGYKLRTRPRNPRLYEKLRKKTLHELENTKISSHLYSS